MQQHIHRATLSLLRFGPALMFLAVVLLFGSQNPAFISFDNFVKIVDQSVPVAILAIGMTFVLLTAGIDLSVGAIMYVAVAICGLVLPDATVVVAVFITMVLGSIIGIANGLLSVVFRVAPFIVTFATMSILRGTGRWLTETKPVFMGEQTTEFGRADVIGSGLPWSLAILFLVATAGWCVLQQTGFGRSIYAVGNNRAAATKAGLPVPGIIVAVYAVCGLCAGIAGFVSVAQQGTAHTTFGNGLEFQAIAAAVLGGTSLFGGRGGVWGALFGAVLVRMVTSGLNSLNTDPYLYPLFTAAVIFLAVAMDSSRNQLLEAMNRRT